MDRLNCLRCEYEHKDNGNCTAVGGFCTAVPAAHCKKLKEYLDTGLTPEEIIGLCEMDKRAKMADLESTGFLPAPKQRPRWGC